MRYFLFHSRPANSVNSTRVSHRIFLLEKGEKKDAENMEPVTMYIFKKYEPETEQKQ